MNDKSERQAQASRKLDADYLQLNDRAGRATEVVELGSFRFDKGGGGWSDR